MFDKFLAELRFCAFDNLVDTTKVIGGFDDIVHPHAFLGDADGVCFKNKARLLVGQAAALHVVGVVGQLHLYLVVDTAFAAGLHFVREYLREGGGRFLCRRDARGLGRILRDIPCLSGQKRAIYAPLCAVIPDAAFGQVPQLCGLLYFMTSTHLGALNKAQRNKIRPVSTPV